MLAGKLKTQHGVEKIEKCIERCCKEDRCHVALMLGKICYSMECADAHGCKPKPAPEVIKAQNPLVAYVKRGTITMGKLLIDLFYSILHMFCEQSVLNSLGAYFIKSTFCGNKEREIDCGLNRVRCVCMYMCVFVFVYER